MLSGMEQPTTPPPSPDRACTEAEYLRVEAASSFRHEYIGGRIIAMAGGTHRHGIIALNIGAALVPRFRDTPCVTSGSDVRVRVAATGDYLYPDLTVVCDEPVYVPPDRAHTLVNPQVVVEVLSASAATRDLGEKLDDYMRVASLRQYVVVAQDQAWARSFVRTASDGRWDFGPIARGLEAELAFPSLALGVPMAEVYAKVRLDAAD